MKEIVLMRGKEIVQRYPLTKELYIMGRSKDCDMVFDHAKVSRQHARLVLENGNYVIQDLNSTNYVFVNGTRVKQKKLEANDRIQVSSEILLMYLENAPAQQEDLKSQTFVDVKGHFIHKDDLHRLKAVTRSVVLLNNLDAILMQILKEGIKLTRAERGLIVLTDKDKILWPYATTFRIDKDKAEQGRADVSHSILKEALQSKKSVVRFNDKASESGAEISDSMMSLKIFSAMCAPLVLEDRVIGLFYVDARQLMNNFTEVDQFLFDYLADHAAIAIFNAKRYADQQSQIEKLQVQLGSLESKYQRLEAEHGHCQNDGSVIPTIPVLQSYSAGGVVLNSNGQVLVVSQKGVSWSLPKGRIESGEEPAITAQREIFEESGISYLRMIQSLGNYQRTALDETGQENPNEIKTIYMYLFTTEQLQLAPQDPENPEARWVSVQDAQHMLTHPKDKAFLKQAFPQIESWWKRHQEVPDKK